ncbi:MAG TPA: polysaccharide deacetylase family protein [Solirubrobacteraceae bacterium]|nr:polysaccharide deacetylase family protein [Solirubrobacteraceae bacterium]
MACLALTLAACGRPDDEAAPDARSPRPAPRVVLTAAERATWAPRPSDRSVVPVLRYHGVDPQTFARHMVLLDHAGYSTITLGDLVRLVKGQSVSLPPHALLVTFDGGRLDSWTGSDGILRELGMNAVLFVDVGRVEAEDPNYLTWDELNTVARTGRWDVQLQSGTGNRLIRYGAGPSDIGPFYAYRGADEVLGGWRERVFSDITYGEQQLAFHVQGYRPLAFAPPYGNYGQAGSNDRRIGRELLARVLLSFELVFTQDRSGLASAGTTNPLGRFDITRNVTDRELHAFITSEDRPADD